MLTNDNLEVHRLDALEFQNMRDEWNQLLAASPSDNLFLTWEWMHTWWNTFKSGKRLYLLAVREQGRLIGLAPFYVSRDPLPGVRVLRLCSAEELYPDYLDVIARRTRERVVMESVFRYLNAHRRDWSYLELDNLLAESTVIRFGAEFMVGFRESWEISSTCPHIRVQGTYDEFLTTQFGGKKRHNLKRQEAMLLKQDNVRYVRVEDPAVLPIAIAQLFELHNRRAQERGIHSTFSTPPGQQFHTTFSAMMLERGVVALDMLYDGETPIGGTYSFEYAGKMFFYQTGFDPAWSKFSAGTVLLTLLIRHTFDRQLNEFDFLKGDEDYKKPWMTGHRTQFRLRLYRQDVAGATLASLRAARSAFAPMLRGIRAEPAAGMAKAFAAALPLVTNRLARLRQLIYHRRTVMVLTHEGQPVAGDLDGLRIVRCEASDVGDRVQASMVRAGGWKSGEFIRRCRLQDVCYAVLDGDRCVHYAWTTRAVRELEEVGFSARISTRDCWIYDCHTDPDYRGRAIFPRVLAHIVNDLSSRGGNSAWIDVETDNVPSLRAIRKAGFVEVLTAERTAVFSTLTFKRHTRPQQPELQQRLRDFQFH